MIVFIVFPRFYLREFGQGRKQVMARNRTVLEASDEANRLGVRAGNTVSLARRRCPGLEVQDFRPEDFLERFEKAWSVISKFTPEIETTDFHHGYLDITNDIKRYGNADAFVDGLGDELLKKSGLRFGWGGGADKWMAWLARGHNQFITPAMESLVLSKLPVESMSLPERVTERLHHFDVHTVAQVMALPSGFLESHLGFDRNFVLKCLTRHKEPVRPNFPHPEQSAEVMVNDWDEVAIERSISQVCSSLNLQLNEARVQPTCLRLMFRLVQGSENAEHKISKTKLSQSRLERIVHESMPKGRASRLKGIRIEARGLIPVPSHQSVLWDDALREKQEEKLLTMQDRLNTRFGSDTIIRGNIALERQQPRFAQLIFQSRGLTLP